MAVSKRHKIMVPQHIVVAWLRVAWKKTHMRVLQQTTKKEQIEYLSCCFTGCAQ
jgi:hypothetical protein